MAGSDSLFQRSNLPDYLSPLTSIEGHVRDSLAWLQGEAGAIKHFVTGYLPSAGAAAAGVFLGFRRK